MKIFGSFQRDRACDSFSLFFLRLFILFFFHVVIHTSALLQSTWCMHFL